MNTTDLQIIEIRQVNAQQVDKDKTMYNHHAVGLSRYVSAPPLSSMRFAITTNIQILDISTCLEFLKL